MKTWLILFATFVALPASADNIWITLHDGKNEQVAESGPKGSLTALEHGFTLLFGESSAQIAVVSYNKAAAQYQLRLLDKETRQQLAIWQIPLPPVQQLSGPAPDIMLLGETAYLLTHAGVLAPGTQYTRNELGGGFNVMRITLRTGETKVLPLGAGFLNPRLNNYNGIPLVTDWAGYAVSRLAPDGKEMIGVIGPDELSDILPAERTHHARRNLPYDARADYVAVPSAGVFRLSKFGLLHRVAGPDLAPLPAPHASLALGPAQNKELLLAVTSEKGPAIAVVRRAREKRTLAFIDAATLSVIWERDLPSGTSPMSMVSAGPDAVLYIDQQKGALMRTSRDGTVVIRDLPSQYHGSARILSAGIL
jgi:hypothetical protein